MHSQKSNDVKHKVDAFQRELPNSLQRVTINRDNLDNLIMCMSQYFK